MKNRFGLRPLLAGRLGAALALSAVPIILGANAPASKADGPAKTISLPGVSGGFDHLAFDERRGRLFATASDQGTVEVVDLGKGAKVRSLTGFVSPHNIVIRSGRPTILIVDSEASKSRLIDAATLRTIRDLPLELGANCTLYDAQTNRLYVTTGGDRVKMAKSTIIAIDPDTGKVLQSAELPSIHLQPIALDPATNRLFVDMADTNMVAVVDAKTLQLQAQWPVGKAERNSAIAFDALHHRWGDWGSSPSRRGGCSSQMVKRGPYRAAATMRRSNRELLCRIGCFVGRDGHLYCR